MVWRFQYWILHGAGKYYFGFFYCVCLFSVKCLTSMERSVYVPRENYNPITKVFALLTFNKCYVYTYITARVITCIISIFMISTFIVYIIMCILYPSDLFMLFTWKVHYINPERFNTLNVCYTFNIYPVRLR